MSRIHDALKKAEQERASVPTPEIVFSQGEAVRPEDGADEQSPAAISTGETADPGAASMPSLASDGFLRFDDLMARCAHPRWQLDPKVNVFANGSSSSRGAEQFRTLRSRLYQLRSNQPLRTLLITSAVPAEGKTFVASNLSHAIVRQPDRRVLVIDADLRCPRLHLPFGAPTSPGLTDYLRGEADEAAVIQCGQGSSNLCLITGGSEVTNPSELLANGRLATLLKRVIPVFDWVILDSPPCLPVADATILAEFCDAVLLVVRAGVTPSDIAQRALQELQSRNIAGVVLNAVEENQAYGSYYYKAYGSDSGGGDSQRPPSVSHARA
ncbi:MAG: CpsD/CapB family tyrosine-protein kinase [Candidatus Acidiferrales bacterium]